MTRPATARAERAPVDAREAAREYAARGWAVVPIPRARKAPAGPGWQRGGHTAEDISRTGNVGLLLGLLSGGLKDADLDTAEAVAAAPYLLPPTTMRHGRPGAPLSHWWYQTAADLRRDIYVDPTRRDANNRPVMLVELRGSGHQTVVPPSIHEDTGELIAWAGPLEPTVIDTEVLRTAVARVAAVAMLAPRWPDGARHDAGQALAGLLLRGGMSQSDAEQFVEALAHVACDSGWRVKEAQEYIRSVRDTKQALADGKPAIGGPRLADILPDGQLVVAQLREWLGLRTADVEAEDSPPLDLWGSALAGSPALDLSTLPDVLAALAADVGARHGCDPALVALPALAVCAGAIDDRHQLQPRQHDTEWRVSARLWVTPVADVGDGKTPALATALKPLRAVDLRWAEEDRGPQRRYALALRTYERETRRWLDRGSQGPPPEEPARPPVRRRLVEDITTEALSDVLADSAAGVLIGVDELSGLIGGMDAYRPAGTTKDQPLYLMLYEGGPRLIERVRRGKIAVTNWGASLVGGIQPARLRQLADRIMDDGLLARCIVYVARSAPDPMDRPPDREALDAYSSSIEWLIGLPGTPTIYTMTPDAHRRREYITRTARAVSALPSTSSGLRGHLAKWEGLFGRLLLTWHLTAAAHRCESPATVIEADAADRVARLMIDFLLPHAAYVYGELLGQDHLTHARWIAGYILARGSARISARDIARAYHALREDRHALDDAMETLTVAGWVSPVDPQAGRRPSRWRVSPQVHTVFAGRAAAERARREEVRRRLRDAVETLGVAGEDCG